MGNFNIDSHKLNFHPRRIADWLEADSWTKAKKVYPIYLEISPCGWCNHRCKFCSLDFMGYKKISLGTKYLTDTINEMARLGVKSIMFGGEGEPLLHKDMAKITIEAKRAGIDTAFTTNASCLTEEFCRVAIKHIEWIKVSINAGTAKTYAEIHGKNHFNLVLKNIANAVKIKKEKKSSCIIGGQILLLPENYGEVSILAEKLKEIGCNYLVVKPHSQHPRSKVKTYAGVDYSDIDLGLLGAELGKLKSDNFEVIFRENAMKRLEKGKFYRKCLSTPFFWAYITAGGDVYSCSMFLGDERFRLGNIRKESFEGIWEGERRRANWLMMEKFNAGRCRKNCRMDECNRFLHRLKNPLPQHVNFI